MAKQRRPRGPRTTGPVNPAMAPEHAALVGIEPGVPETLAAESGPAMVAETFGNEEPAAAPAEPLTDPALDPAEIATTDSPDADASAIAAEPAGSPEPAAEPEPVTEAAPEVHPADLAADLAADIAADPVAVAGVSAAVPELAALVAPTLPIATRSRLAAVPDRYDFTEIGITVAQYMRREGEAAVAHCYALAAARTPADVIRLQVDEFQRAADASLTCWTAVARKASRVLADR